MNVLLVGRFPKRNTNGAGRDELAVIQTMLAIYDAQREYAQTNHDGEGVVAYASKMVSSPGKHNGLYWPAGPDETPSPL